MGELRASENAGCADDINFFFATRLPAFEVCAFQKTAEHIVRGTLLVKKLRTSIDPASLTGDYAGELELAHGLAS